MQKTKTIWPMFIIICIGLSATQMLCCDGGGYKHVEDAYFSRGVYNTEDPVTVQDRLPNEINADDLREFDRILDSIGREHNHFYAIVLNKIHKGENLIVLYYTKFIPKQPFFLTSSHNGAVHQNALAVDLLTPIGGIVRFHKKVNTSDVCIDILWRSQLNDKIELVGRVKVD